MNLAPTFRHALLRCAFVATLACVLPLDAARAQRATGVFENDAVARADRDYTYGFRGSVVFDDFARDRLAAEAFDFVRPGLITFAAPAGAVRQQFEWIAGQSIFTPDHVSNLVRAPGDRPFGGWLYTGFNAAQEVRAGWGAQLDSFEVLAGAVGGSASLAYEVQNGFHRLLGQKPIARGYELRNEPGILLSWDRRWMIGTEFGNRWGADIIPSVGLTAGNVFTYASAGAVVRVGRSLQTSWGPAMVRPSVSGTSFITPDPTGPYLGFSLFGGVQGRAVAHNIFLDGNTIDPSISVTRKPWVYDLIAGIEGFTQTGHTLSFTVVRRSQEYTTQPKPAIFGSIAASVRF